MQKQQDKQQDFFKAYKNVFDFATVHAVWKLITEGWFEGLESPIKIGKESNVFSAITKHKQRIAVKIYRIAACDFFHMSRYLAMDKRFRPRKSRRSIVLSWAQREFKNLCRASNADISVPKPLAFEENVLAMKFIGKQLPEMPAAAPLMKDSFVNEEFFSLLIENVKKLYAAGLVHGDLSEFNVLNWNNKPIIIDLSHATPTSAPASAELLERDVKNLCRFFNKHGFKIEDAELLKEIKSAEK
jgi:RIO kinase 1